MNKYCVITLIFNNYEFVREPKEVSKNCNYILFTDNKKLKSNFWKIIYIPKLDTNKLSGIQKMLIIKYQWHKYIPNVDQYSYIFRIDGSIQLYKPLDNIVNYLSDNNYDLFVSIHNDRSCFKHEYGAWNNYRNSNIMFGFKFFEYCNKIDNIGLIETTIMCMKNCPNVLKLMDDQYESMKQYSNLRDNNDQSYFTYNLYKNLNDLNVYYTSRKQYQSSYMQWFVHNTNIKINPQHRYQRDVIFGEKRKLTIFN